MHDIIPREISLTHERIVHDLTYTWKDKVSATEQWGNVLQSI